MSTQENRRRSERVLLRMTVVVLAEDEEHQPVREEAQTQVVNAHGGLMTLKTHLHVGQAFVLKNPKSGLEQGCRVVRTEEVGLEDYNTAFEFDQPIASFWPIVFPPSDWAPSVRK